MTLTQTPVEQTDETMFQTEYLNFLVVLSMQIKRFPLEEFLPT